MALLIPELICETVYDIPVSFFTDRGIRLLMLDIDNTLVTYDDEYPTEENLLWFSQLSEQGISVVFVSNNHADRVEKYAKRADRPYFADAAKPSTKYYKEAMRKHSLQPSECAGVGDQIFTDVLAAHRAGCIGVLVSPIKDLTTFFVKSKRFLEKPFIAAYHRRKRKEEKHK